MSKRETFVEFVVGWTLDGPVIVRHYLDNNNAGKHSNIK